MPAGIAVKIQTLLVALTSALFLIGCGTASNPILNQKELTEFKELIDGKSYQIEASWAFPQMTQGLNSLANAGLLMPGSTAARIDLMGNSNYLKVIGDSVSIALPYFGERQMGGAYDKSNVGLEYDGKPLEYTAFWDMEQERYRIEMKVRDKTETLEYNITLFPSGKGDITVNSTHRFTIRYSGVVGILPE
jgi:hypothetical protein